MLSLDRVGVSADASHAARIARELRAGIVWINDTQPAPTEMPWGGYKQSGIGRELGKHGVEDYLESKSVYVNLSGRVHPRRAPRVCSRAWPEERSSSSTS